MKKNTAIPFALIIIIYINVGCSFKREQVPYSTEILDTLSVQAPGLVVYPGVFEDAFVKGRTGRVGDSTVQLYGVNIGNLNLPSGQVVACDPLHIEEYGIPFTQLFPTGVFPVHLSIAKQGVEERIAFARIYFNEAPVARWEMALQKGQQSLPVGGKERHDYGVDGGLGIFADPQACRAINKDNLMSLDDSVYKKLDRHTHFDWRYNIHEFGAHNMAMFSTGFGDGRYASYIGFDSTGRPCRLLTDFDVVRWK